MIVHVQYVVSRVQIDPIVLQRCNGPIAKRAIFGLMAKSAIFGPIAKREGEQVQPADDAAGARFAAQ